MRESTPTGQRQVLLRAELAALVLEPVPAAYYGQLMQFFAFTEVEAGTLEQLLRRTAAQQIRRSGTSAVLPDELFALEHPVRDYLLGYARQAAVLTAVSRLTSGEPVVFHYGDIDKLIGRLALWGVLDPDYQTTQPWAKNVIATWFADMLMALDGGRGGHQGQRRTFMRYAEYLAGIEAQESAPGLTLSTTLADDRLRGWVLGRVGGAAGWTRRRQLHVVLVAGPAHGTGTLTVNDLEAMAYLHQCISTPGTNSAELMELVLRYYRQRRLDY